MILYCSDPDHDDPGELDLASIDYGDGWRVSGPLRARIDRIAEEAHGAAARDRTEPPRKQSAITMRYDRFMSTGIAEILHYRLTITCDCGLRLTARGANWARFEQSCEAGGVTRLDLRTAISAYQRHADG